MLGNFTYCNPTKLYFGKGAVENLRTELPGYGKNVLLVYGGGSIKKNGIYDQVVSILRECGKTIAEDAGVMPNPTVEKLHEGIARARACKADLILAVGGGSVCDYAKAVSVSVNCDEEPWDKYFIRFEEPTCPIVPVACVLTMVGTGSEMNGGSVITNHAQKLKIGHVFGEEVFPRFSILDPTYTFTLPRYQMISGFTTSCPISWNSTFRERTTTRATILPRACSARSFTVRRPRPRIRRTMRRAAISCGRRPGRSTR